MLEVLSIASQCRPLSRSLALSLSLSRASFLSERECVCVPMPPRPVIPKPEGLSYLSTPAHFHTCLTIPKSTPYMFIRVGFGCHE